MRNDFSSPGHSVPRSSAGHGKSLESTATLLMRHLSSCSRLVFMNEFAL